jgi:BirA family transcriptional regulator, biotin operon repressor / biotin---[acetyl-CoA-carboxylase] ligase
VKELALAGEPPGMAVLAEEQLQGRGRLGRDWVSPPGAGVWMTVMLPGATPPHDPGAGLITLAAGLAVRRAVHAVTGFAPGLKWPNDVMAGDAKLCGILGEMLGEHGVALGIGVNVHDSPPAAALGGRRATHLDRELGHGHAVERNLLAASILNELEKVDDDLRAGRGAQVLAAWRESCNHLGQAVTVDLGARMEHGIAVSVNAEGGLLLSRPDGSLTTLWSGSLFVGALPAGDTRDTGDPK